MYITWEEYTKYKYSAVPETEFERYAYNAETVVRKYTFDRISDADLHPDEIADAEVKRIAEMNQSGVCELVDVLHKQEQETVGDAGAAIKSFSNEGYSETLDTSGQSAEVVQGKIQSIMRSYFTSEQLFRGVT